MLRKCIFFCDKNKECLEYYELLVVIINCIDMLGFLLNFDNLKESVDKYIKGGWGKDDDVLDVVLENRCFFIYWAVVLGKCNVLEWMFVSGFFSVVKLLGKGEIVLYRVI